MTGLLWKTLLSRRFRRLLVLLAILASLGLIAWASVMAWQRPCRQAGIGLISTSSACPSLLEDSPLAVALAVWSISLLVWVLGQHNVPSLFFAFIAGVLAAGKMSAIDNEVGGRLFYFLLPWAGPALFTFHVTLLNRRRTRAENSWAVILCAIAAVLSLPLILFTQSSLLSTGWFPLLRLSSRALLALMLILTVWLLFRGYHGRSSLVQQHLRVVIVSMALAFAPFLLLSLLPTTLGASWHVPFELTMLFLIISPLGYVYALYRHRLVDAELQIDCVAIYYLLTVLLLGVYVAGGGVLHRLNPQVTTTWSIQAIIVVGLAYLFVFLQRRVSQFIHWGLWGNGPNYAGVISRLSASLSATLDRATLEHLLVDELSSVMHLARVALLLPANGGMWGLAHAIGLEGKSLPPIPWGSSLISYLQSEDKPMPGAKVARCLNDALLGTAERCWVELGINGLWLPLPSGGMLQGLLLVWARSEESLFTAEEIHILHTLACEAGIAVHNVRHMDETRAGREELARAHQRLLVTREQEQRELAHALHDDVVQHLIAISYRLERSQRKSRGQPLAQASSVESLRQDILETVAKLRRHIRELRPAGLEDLGVAAALDGYVDQLRSETDGATPEIDLDIDRTAPKVPDAVAICIFRTGQEALRNALKHAAAQHIDLSYHVRNGEAILSISDDGCGFRVPERLSELAQTNHFGLVGLAERVAWAGGKLSITSQPGEGTDITVHIPLHKDGNDNG